MSMKKVSNYRNQPQMDDINRLTAAVNDLIESGGQGDKGDKGDDGDNGWTPVLSLVEREDDLVMQVADLVGGTGNPPNFYIGRYVGATGLVTDILDAVNVRGMKGLKGEAGDDGDNGVGVPLGGLTGQVLAKASDDSYDTQWVEAGSGGASTLLELTDTPNNYGSDGQVLGIQSDWQGIPTVEWITPEGGGVESFFDLSETPNDYGSSGQVLTTVLDWMGVPSLQWTTPDSGSSDPIAFTDLTDTPSELGSVGQVPVVFFDSNINDLALRFEDLPEGGGSGGETVTTGTFTPFLSRDNNGTPSQGLVNGEVDVTVAQGTYRKVGNLVTVNINIQWRGATSMTEQIRIDGLPFPMASNQDGLTYSPNIQPTLNRPMPKKDIQSNDVTYIGGQLNPSSDQIWLVSQEGRLMGAGTTNDTRLGLTITATYNVAE